MMSYKDAKESSIEMQEELYQICQKYNIELLVLTEQDVFATLVRSGIATRKSERLAKKFWEDEDFRNGVIVNIDTTDDIIGLIDWDIVNAED
jgi:hypothetical protein